MNSLQGYIADCLALFFPELCAGCGCSLVRNEAEICLVCETNLPYTNFHLIPDNSVARQFWGRVPFISSGAFLFFSKGTKVQNLLHQFKYNQRPEIGLKLGEMYGRQLLASNSFILPDLIVPVPLHPRKQKERGYNQSEYFAMGMSKALSVPVNTTSLKRGHFTSTQTKKSRFLRYENMKNIFFVADEAVLVNKHILLVDDIITTGATIEACSVPLLQVTGCRLSIAGIAFTN